MWIVTVWPAWPPRRPSAAASRLVHDCMHAAQAVGNANLADDRISITTDTVTPPCQTQCRRSSTVTALDTPRRGKQGAQLTRALGLRLGFRAMILTQRVLQRPRRQFPLRSPAPRPRAPAAPVRAVRPLLRHRPGLAEAVRVLGLALPPSARSRARRHHPSRVARPPHAPRPAAIRPSHRRRSQRPPSHLAELVASRAGPPRSQTPTA